MYFSVHIILLSYLNPCQDGPISSQGLGENVVCAGNKTKLFYGN